MQLNKHLSLILLLSSSLALASNSNARPTTSLPLGESDIKFNQNDPLPTLEQRINSLQDQLVTHQCNCADRQEALSREIAQLRTMQLVQAQSMAIAQNNVVDWKQMWQTKLLFLYLLSSVVTATLFK